METIRVPVPATNYLDDLKPGKFYKAVLNDILDCVFEVTDKIKTDAKSGTFNVIAFTHLKAEESRGPMALSSKPVEIPIEDFPLLINWDFKGDKFCELLKGDQ